MATPDVRELTAEVLALKQQVIDLKGQIDRERLAGEGFRRLGEKVVGLERLDDFFSIVVDQVIATFGTENAMVLRLDATGPTVCATCCVVDASPDELARIAALIAEGPRGRARVLTGDDLPPLMGRPVAVVLVGTFVDRSDADATYAVITTVSRAKAPFYPQFGPELAPIFEAYLHHLGALQQHLREREAALRLMQATQHFVPQEFLQALGHADVRTAKLGDAVLRHVTVLFADIRDFTTISEGMSPAETTAFLNGCLSRIGPRVRAHHGFVDKYIGDAIMALFPGAPVDAVRAALAMQTELAKANDGVAANHRVRLGVGIHSGDVMMCTIGETERFEATVISDAVNLTARLEALTKRLGCAVLVTSAVAHALPDELVATSRVLGHFTVKGKAQAAEIVEVFASDDEPVRSAKAETREAFATALAHYRRHDVEGAIALMQSIVDANPNDGPARFWLEHMRHDLTNGPAHGPNSRDVVRLDAK